MPFAIYAHRCPDGTEDGSSKEWGCLRCGKRAEFSGFRYSGVEAMGAFSRFFGVRPYGPHRGAFDTSMKGTWRYCPYCDGVALVTDLAGKSYRLCSECGGFGRIRAVSDETFEAARHAVLERFPDIATRDWRPGRRNCWG